MVQKTFKTTLTNTADGLLDTKQFMDDMEAHLDELDNELGEDERLNRKHPLKRLHNSLFGNFFTPSNMSGYMDCPAGAIWNSLAPKKDYLSTGSVYHEIMEKLVNHTNGDWKKFSDLSEDDIATIKSDVYTEFDRNGERYHKDDVELALKRSLTIGDDGYPNAIGYLKTDNTLPDSSITEVFIKMSTEELMNTIPFLQTMDKNPTIFHTMIGVLDRIDLSAGNCGNIIIDYKTGKSMSQRSIDGYIPQMVVYKWLAAAEFDIPFSTVFLFSPQLTSGPKYFLMDTSISSQVAVWEKICNYSKSLSKAREENLFSYEGTNKYTGRGTANPHFPFPTGEKETFEIEMNYDWNQESDTPVTHIHTTINGKEVK